jgi:hypothetical protein
MTTHSELTHSLERAWSAIRTINHDVPNAVIVIYAHSAGDRRGHFWYNAWHSTNGSQTTDIDEVHISSTILNEPAESVLQTLLHEAAHGLAKTRNLQDTSRQGRYHNAIYARLAAEVGLTTALEPGAGIITPDITGETHAKYQPILNDLQAALTLWQDQQTRRGRGTGKSSHLKLTCPECGRSIRASQKVIDAGPIICQPCKTAFIATA